MPLEFFKFHLAFFINTVDSPLSANGFWVLLQFAVRGRAMFHIGISEKMVVINSGHKIITEITSFMKLVHCMLVWLYVNNYVYTICCILCSWVIADLNRQNNHCWMCFTCCWSLLFWHLSSFSCFYRWFVKPSCANFTFDGNFCCCWLWKIWYLCGNDKWMCVNSWYSMFNWWMWWGVMNGCHENPRRKKWHTNSNTHNCQHLRFLCCCNADGVSSTHSK